MADFLATEVHIEWLLQGLLERSGFGVISSAPGVGKTQLVIHMGISIATGQDFLHWKNSTATPAKVLFLSLEMAHAPIKYFMEKIMAREEYRDLLPVLQENFLVAPVGNSISVDTEGGRNFLESLIESYKPTTVIIDSLGAFTGQSLTDDVAMRSLSSYLQRVRQKYGVSFIFVHHNRKANGDNKKPIELSDLHGSVFITSPADFVLTLWLQDDGRVTLKHVKARLSLPSKQLALIRDHNLHFTVDKETESTTTTISMTDTSTEGKKNGGFRNPFNTG
jgi:RecA-family ATPase